MKLLKPTEIERAFLRVINRDFRDLPPEQYGEITLKVGDTAMSIDDFEKRIVEPALCAWRDRAFGG